MFIRNYKECSAPWRSTQSVRMNYMDASKTLDPFIPMRGIRQGDSLSPYLFILCIDFLGQLIESKCAKNVQDPVKSSKSGLAFSYLFFADDLVLFVKANKENCSSIRSVLDKFCSKSGQTISEAKSKVYFSLNVDSDTRDSFCETPGFHFINFLRKYLGIPIWQPGSSLHEFNFLLERMKQKLAGWKSNFLSMAGRAVLIQVSISTIPAYIMQCVSLPSKNQNGIDKISQNFLWGTTESTKKKKKKSIGLVGIKLPNQKKRVVQAFKQPKAKTQLSLLSSTGDSIQRRKVYGFRFLGRSIALIKGLIPATQTSSLAHKCGRV